MLFTNGYAQDKRIIVHDLVTGEIDSIAPVFYDSTIIQDQTNHYIGNFDSNLELLEQTAPTENTYPNSNFTLKKKAALDYELSTYPVRTSVKLFFEENDTLFNLCSGSIISRKHVLTATHCIARIGTNDMQYDSIYVCPVFNDGEFHSDLNCSYVSKAFFFKDWKLSSEDVSILELAEPIGETTGWISMGYNDSEDPFTDDIFYKFSYPNIQLFNSPKYNGDTLYYAYGNIDIFSKAQLGIKNSVGIPGESGSSIIKVVNDESYISYGVSTFANNMLHTRIRNNIFYSLKNIIEKDLITATSGDVNPSEITLYPNPTTSRLFLKNHILNHVINFEIHDAFSKTVMLKNNHELGIGIDVSNLPSGNYYLRILSKSDTHSFPFTKIEN